MIITITDLTRYNACLDQIKTFHRLFGNGGEVTLEKCLLAADNKMPIGWRAHRFLNDKQLQFYDQHYNEVLNLFDKYLPQWGLFDSEKPSIAGDVDRPEYNDIRDAVWRRSIARLFFEATKR